MVTTWAERFPEGRTLFYEGDDPGAFREQIQAEFGFDPAECPGVYANQPETTDYGALNAMAAEAKQPTWDEDHGWQFHCPAAHLDTVYASRRWPIGS
jgi:hypothetical protein